MNMISTLVGRIGDAEPVLKDTGTSAEKFYIMEATFYDVTMEIVVSEYLIKDAKGRVEVKGFLASEPYYDDNNRKKTKVFIDVVSISPVGEDTPDSNEILAPVRITKVGVPDVTTQGVVNLPIVALNQNQKYKRNIMYLCAKDIAARKLKDVKPGTIVLCKGYIRKRKDYFEILVTDTIDK